jgi:hypothetical protein
MAIFVEDTYQDSRNPGNVIGTTSTNGVVRRGVDLESRLSIDNNALRIQPMLNPGWGRSGIVYGPFERQNGLALLVRVLNGHNSSQAGTIIDSFIGRMKQWLRGSYSYGRTDRAFRWIRGGQKKIFLRKIRYWYKFSREKPGLEYIDTNLALGWFSEEAPKKPLEEENSLCIRSTGAENGEIRVNVGKTLQASIRSLQNIPVYFFVVLRESGAAYYAATLAGVSSLTAYPQLQPLAIDPITTKSPVFGGFFQSVLGEIGFRVDTRVYGTKIALLDEFNGWYGTAHAADKLIGSGGLDKQNADIGGKWTTHQGSFLRTETGIYPDTSKALATLFPLSPSGLIHALINVRQRAAGRFGLVWRFRDSENYFVVLFSEDGCEIKTVISGRHESLSTTDCLKLEVGDVNSIQIVDQGNSFQVFLNGRSISKNPITSDLLNMESGVGIFSENPSLSIHSFEAHPRNIRVPEAIELDLLQVKYGKETIILDDFQEKSGSLENSKTRVGGVSWNKIFGEGNFVLRDGKCWVDASVKRPNPGRTAYAAKWDFPEYAELIVDIRPPGAKRGEGERGRGGVIFYQDADNFIIVSTWLDDNMDGASISSFFQINGFEDIYDAVWTNVGNRISFGIPYRLRVTFDGMIYTAYVNDEPVLYRSLQDVYPSIKPLQIKKVGLVANWEWGEDTGSAFLHFEAKKRSDQL